MGLLLATNRAGVVQAHLSTWAPGVRKGLLGRQDAVPAQRHCHHVPVCFSLLSSARSRSHTHPHRHLLCP